MAAADEGAAVETSIEAVEDLAFVLTESAEAEGNTYTGASDKVDVLLAAGLQKVIEAQQASDTGEYSDAILLLRDAYKLFQEAIYRGSVIVAGEIAAAEVEVNGLILEDILNTANYPQEVEDEINFAVDVLRKAATVLLSGNIESGINYMKLAAEGLKNAEALGADPLDTEPVSSNIVGTAAELAENRLDQAEKYPNNPKAVKHVKKAKIAKQDAITATLEKDYPAAANEYKKVVRQANNALKDGSGLKKENIEATTTALIPERYALSQNYPNPFNPSTTIVFELPEANTVTLRIYNIKGQLVRTLLNNGAWDAGRHSVKWDGRNQSGNRIASGIYIYHLSAGSFSKARRMILLK